MGIENSDSEVKALKKALDSLDEVLAPNLTKIVPLPHKFPLYVCIIVFALSFVFSLVGQLMGNALTLWQVVYPIMFVGGYRPFSLCSYHLFLRFHHRRGFVCFSFDYMRSSVRLSLPVFCYL